MYVFVYGTLKKNEPNHHWLTNEEHGRSRFISTGRTCTKYPLVISSRYNIPFLLDSPGNGKNIYGEIYEIDEKMLSNLDILEEYPKLYTRRLEKVEKTSFPPSKMQETSNANKIVEAWAYFLPDFKKEMLELEALESYSSNGLHGKPYVASLDDLADRNDI